jgi:four helix bundle protein
MNRREMQDRTKKFALRIIKLVANLPSGRTGDVLGRQLLKSGTSIGANYREACRASSRRHFVTTLEISAREADESQYWLELLAESNLIKASRLADLRTECTDRCHPNRCVPHRKTQEVLNSTFYFLLSTLIGPSPAEHSSKGVSAPRFCQGGLTCLQRMG